MKAIAFFKSKLGLLLIAELILKPNGLNTDSSSGTRNISPSLNATIPSGHEPRTIPLILFKDAWEEIPYSFSKFVFKIKLASAKSPIAE